MALTITTPAAPGDYQCEIDLAHEGVRWFRDRDSAVVRFPVRVHAEGASEGRAPVEASVGNSMKVFDGNWPAAAPGDPHVANPGDFPMHGVHTDVVSQLIAAGGGELLERTTDRSCGQDWISYRYFVRKPTT